MINIEFISQCLDCSGYASTARSTILALKKRGYGLKLIYKDFGARKIELTDKNRDLLGLFDSDIVPDIRHVHLTPENIMEFNKRDIPLIAYPAWETTKLPIEWVGYMNEADVLVVPCEYQKQVMINDGVSVPIHVVGHLVDTDLFNINNNIIKQDNMFCFYSIFQWNERKNPYAILKAYWMAMSGVDDVELVLKTYISNPCNIEDVKNKILAYKQELGLKHYPKCKLLFGNLSDKDIVNIHSKYDCYLSLSRSEGFGMPIVEAMACGKPVIATNFYGSCDYLTSDNSYPVDYSLVPVSESNGYWYRADQMWAEPNINQAIDIIRKVYDNRNEALQKGINARKIVVEKYSPDVFISSYNDVLKKTIDHWR